MFDFSKINPYESYLTPDYILKFVTEEEIFRHYFPDFEIGNIFNSPFRIDKHPSFGFYYGSQIRAKDLSKGDSWNCFQFVMELYKISFNEALSKIYNDLRVDPTRTQLPSRPLITNERKKLKINKIEFSKKILNYWSKYDITLSELQYNNAYNFNKLFIKQGKVLNTITSISPICTAFLIDYDKKYYYKIYQPNSKYKWINNIPIEIPFGLSTLPYISDTLIVTKSWKDMVILRKYFTDVIATQNESITALKLIINLPYKNKLIFYDNDQPGIVAAEEIKDKYNYEYFTTNDINSKDISDYYINNGKQKTEEFINSIKDKYF